LHVFVRRMYPTGLIFSFSSTPRSVKVTPSNLYINLNYSTFSGYIMSKRAKPRHKLDFRDWLARFKEVVEAIRELHREKELISWADIRHELGIDWKSTDAKRVKRILDLLVECGFMTKEEIDKCPTCGVKLKGPFYALKEVYKPRIEPYFGPPK